jgi:hypothetical protein
MNTNNQAPEKTESERMRDQNAYWQKRQQEQRYWDKMDNMTDAQWRRMERGE